MNDPPEKIGQSMDPSYPFGIIAAAMMNTIGVMFASYFLYLFGTILGFMAGSGRCDFSGLADGIGLLVLLVIPYVILGGFYHISILLCGTVVMVLCYVCLYSESLKQRLILLGVIFLIAFADAWYVSTI